MVKKRKQTMKSLLIDLMEIEIACLGAEASQPKVMHKPDEHKTQPHPFCIDSDIVSAHSLSVFVVLLYVTRTGLPCFSEGQPW